jgi:uncharacterized membrane protein YeaQ/YmgE (transglycosylase-associated protein family)
VDGAAISAILVGLINGALGRLVLPGHQDMPIWLAIGIGFVAALIGSVIASAPEDGETRDRLDQAHHPGGLATGGVALVADRYAP